MVDRGKREYLLKDRSNGSLKKMNVNVTDCRKPLLAVADLNDQGFDVHFTRGFGHYAVNDNGKRIEFVRRNYVFEYDVEVLPHSSFQGQPPA